MDWHVLFAKTGYEQKVVAEILANWKIDGIKPFVPMYDVKFRRHGRAVIEKRRLFPGYVFIETEMTREEFRSKARSFIVNSRNVFKLLRYNDFDSNKNTASINGNEQKTLLKLFQSNDYHVDLSTGIIVGNKVRVTDGPLMGYESIIKQIKRHRMEAVIEIELMGSVREITVGLEVVKRID